MQHFVSLMVLATLLLASCAKPIADFTYTGQDAPVPCTVQFANQSRHADTWFWEFGNGETSSEASPSCTYTLSGNYTITLTASKGDNAHRMEKTIQITAPEPCLVEIQTPYGNMLAQLSNETPLHRDNFMHLVEQQFYDSLLFHRVIRNFMIQGGDPNSKGAGPDARLGSGGPGYQIDAEFRDDMVHTKGAIAAARTGDQVNPQKNPPDPSSTSFRATGSVTVSSTRSRPRKDSGIPRSNGRPTSAWGARPTWIATIPCLAISSKAWR